MYGSLPELLIEVAYNKIRQLFLSDKSREFFRGGQEERDYICCDRGQVSEEDYRGGGSDYPNNFAR